MAANVQLSAEELKLVSDPAWILTKNSIIKKVVEMFAELSGEWRKMEVGAGADIHLAIAALEPKISKGEQYKGLPWVMLDYPRMFGKEDVMAVRTMFWWGNCFMVTLHLKGKYLRSYLPVIREHREELEKAGFRPTTAEDQWEHEHSPGEWEGIEDWGDSGDGGDGLSGTRDFLKLAVTIGFDRWNTIEALLTEKFEVLARVLVA